MTLVLVGRVCCAAGAVWALAVAPAPRLARTGGATAGAAAPSRNRSTASCASALASWPRLLSLAISANELRLSPNA